MDVQAFVIAASLW